MFNLFYRQSFKAQAYPINAAAPFWQTWAARGHGPVHPLRRRSPAACGARARARRPRGTAAVLLPDDPRSGLGTGGLIRPCEQTENNQ